LAARGIRLGHGDAETVGGRVHGRRQTRGAGSDDHNVIVGRLWRIADPERIAQFFESRLNEDDLVVDDHDWERSAGGATSFQQIPSRLLVEPLVRLVDTCQEVAEAMVGRSSDQLDVSARRHPGTLLGAVCQLRPRACE
jgi:hypothetical protein